MSFFCMGLGTENWFYKLLPNDPTFFIVEKPETCQVAIMQDQGSPTVSRQPQH